MIKADTVENIENSIFQGSCLCTAVRFSVQGNPEKVFICYCQDCVKNSGAPYQLVRISTLPGGINKSITNNSDIKVRQIP